MSYNAPNLPCWRPIFLIHLYPYVCFTVSLVTSWGTSLCEMLYQCQSAGGTFCCHYFLLTVFYGSLIRMILPIPTSHLMQNIKVSQGCVIIINNLTSPDQRGVAPIPGVNTLPVKTWKKGQTMWIQKNKDSIIYTWKIQIWNKENHEQAYRIYSVVFVI